MSNRVLHLLSQRPSLTGSGITLDALVRQASLAGWEQRVLVGVPSRSGEFTVGDLDSDRVDAVRFQESDLDFPVPGMSDVMPYDSIRFSDMSPRQLQSYRDAWRARLRAIRDEFQPDVIHCHHVWILGSLVRDVFPATPLVLHGHGTDLRQLTLCPHLAEEVLAGCRRADAIATLHQEHVQRYGGRLGLDPARVREVGAGYDEALFHRGAATSPRDGVILYAGKLSHSKGLPQLLDAVEALARDVPAARLHVAGGGAGDEANALRQRLETMTTVTYLGRLPQQRLADEMRQAAVFVLPSFYEGLPLVLVEALACGCRLVSTDLHGVRSGLVPHLDTTLGLVPAPRLIGADTPVAEDLPAFVQNLTESLRRSLQAPPLAAADIKGRVESFTWRQVFRRVEQLWCDVIAGGRSGEAL